MSNPPPGAAGWRPGGETEQQKIAARQRNFRAALADRARYGSTPPQGIGQSARSGGGGGALVGGQPAPAYSGPGSVVHAQATPASYSGPGSVVHAQATNVAYQAAQNAPLATGSAAWWAIAISQGVDAAKAAAAPAAPDTGVDSYTPSVPATPAPLSRAAGEASLSSKAYVGTKSASAGGGYAGGFSGAGATAEQASAAAATAAAAGDHARAAAIVAATDPIKSAQFAIQQVRSDAAIDAGIMGTNIHAVGTPEWWIFEKASRTLTASSNVRASPASIPTPIPQPQIVIAPPDPTGLGLPGPMGTTVTNIYDIIRPQHRTTLPGPMGTTVKGLYGIFGTTSVVPKEPEQYRMPPRSGGGVLDTIGFGMLALGTAMATNTEDFFSEVEKNIPSNIPFVSTNLKFITGVVEATPQVVSMVPLIGGSAYVFGRDVKWGTSQIIPTGTEIATGMYERAIEKPERTAGNIVGAMILGEVGIPKAVESIKYLSPTGIDIIEIPASTGARSTIAYAYTKPFASGMEQATARGTMALSAVSEPAKLIGSPSLAAPPGSINIVGGKVPSFSSVEVAVQTYDALAGRKGSFLHGTTDVRFVQSLLEEGEVIVGAGAKGTEPLYVSSVPDVVYQRFLLGAQEAQPGSSAIVRVTGAPKTVTEALAYEGSIYSPELTPGLYPGVKPLSGWTGTLSRFFGLQQEMIVPAGSKLAVTDVSFIEIGGVKVPIIDVVVGKANILQRAKVGIKQFGYRANAATLPEVGLGKPTEFLKGSDIVMPNPLQVGSEWTGAQRAILDPYIKEMAAKPGAPLGLKAVAAGREALPLFREVTFVQREPVGQILAGKEMSESTIAKIFESRAAMGEDVVSGGSTTIRANLGKGFFDKSMIGDIDAWLKSTKVAEQQSKEIAIIARDQPSAVTSRAPGLQEGFPVAEVRIQGAAHPLTELHSIEAFPTVAKAENIGTLEAVGGTTVTGPKTGYTGGVLKSSAAFDNIALTQRPGGVMDIALNPKGIKHAVGTSAVAKESASLFYGRDVEITGMKPSYAKGRVMERYASALDELLKTQKGEAAKTVKRYQSAIEINPLDLPETKAAKAKAYAASGQAPLSQILGIDIGVPTPRTAYPVRAATRSVAQAPESSAAYSIIAALGFVVPRAITPTTTYPAQRDYSTSEIPTKTVITNYPIGETQIDKNVSGYSFTGVPQKTGGYPATTPITTHDIPVGDYPVSDYPPTDYPPFTPPPTTPPTTTPTTPPPPPEKTITEYAPMRQIPVPLKTFEINKEKKKEEQKYKMQTRKYFPFVEWFRVGEGVEWESFMGVVPTRSARIIKSHPKSIPPEKTPDKFYSMKEYAPVPRNIRNPVQFGFLERSLAFHAGQRLSKPQQLQKTAMQRRTAPPTRVIQNRPIVGQTKKSKPIKFGSRKKSMRF